MYKKANTIIIGDEKNKARYMEDHSSCEVCGSSYMVAIHHHQKQNKRYKTERYTIELPENYSTLCTYNCHKLVHNRSQFMRDMDYSSMTFKGIVELVELFEYFQVMKDGNDIGTLLEGNNGDDS